MRGWLRGKPGPCIHFSLPSPFRNSEPPTISAVISSASSNHISPVYSGVWPRLLPFCSNFPPYFPFSSCLVLNPLVFPLWLPTVNIVPTHSIKDLLFQKWHPIGGDAACPEVAFLIHGLGSHILDRTNLSYGEASPNLCPKHIKQ